MLSKLRGRLTFANVTSAIALFAALGLGTAWALDANSVESKHIAPGAVKPADTNLVKYDRVAGEETTTGSVNDPLSGPRVEVKVKPGDVLLLHARAEGRRVEGTGACWAALRIDLPQTEDDTTVRVFTYDSSSYIRRYVASGGSAVGTTIAGHAEAREIPIALKGTAEISFEYQSESGAAVCAYRERGLYAGIAR